jgi:hypothetical protein
MTQSNSVASHRQTALIVLGMHRSGTSALTRVLSLLGAALPQNIMPPGPGNDSGHWEPVRVVELHDDILSRVGSAWSALSGPSEAWFASRQATDYVEKIKDIVRLEYLDAPLFVAKDPRLSLLFPLWARALFELNIDCKPVVAIRNPTEVARSLCLRERSEVGEREWCLNRARMLTLRYNLSAERWTRMHRRAFCHFDDLLRDWKGSARRIGNELGIAWPDWSPAAEIAIDSFLRPSLRHHTAPDDLADDGDAWAETMNLIYTALKGACSGDEIDPKSFDDDCFSYGQMNHMLNAERERLLRGHRREVQDIEREVTLMRESMSWRLTAPLRRVVDRLRTLRDGLSTLESDAIANRFKTPRIEPAE